LEIESDAEEIETDVSVAAVTGSGSSESELLDEDTAPWSITADDEVPVESELSTEEPVIEEEPTAVETPETEASLEQAPEAVSEPDETVIQEPESEGFDLNDPDAAMAWLEGLAEKQGAAADQLTSNPDDRPETPEWLKESVEGAQSSGDIPTYEPTETVEGLKRPLEEAADLIDEVEPLPEVPEIEVSAESEEVAEAISTDEIPDWLQDLKPEGEIPSETDEEAPVPEMDEAVDQVSEPSVMTEEVPDWLSEPESEEEMGVQEAVAQDTIEGIIEEPVDDITEWLSSLDAEDTDAEAAPGLTEADIAELEAIDISEDDTAPVAVRTEVPAVEEPPVQETIIAELVPDETEEEPASETVVQEQVEAGLDLEDPDAAMAWLESLAERQGVDAEQLTTSPEDRPDTPDWLMDSVEEAQSSGDIPTYEPTETVEGLAQPATEYAETTGEGEPALEVPETEDDQKLPELVELDETEETIAAAEIPEWLQEIELEPEAEGGFDESPTDEISSEAALTIDEPKAESTPEEALEIEEPSEEMDEVPEPASLDATMISQDIPDWLQDLESDQVEDEIVPEETVSAEDTVAEETSGPDTIPDWLLEPEEEIDLQPEEPEPSDEEITPEPEVQNVVDETVLVQEPVEAEFEEIDTGVGSDEVPEWLQEPEEETEEALEWTLESDTASEPSESETEPEPLSAEIDEVEISQAQTVISNRALAELAEAPDELLDINTASLSELEDLPGIGFVLAQSIINFREENGPFNDVEDLEQVDGIGSTMREQLTNWIQVVAEPVPEAADEKREPESEDEATLFDGQKDIHAGDISAALEKFDGLIQKDLFLEEIIQTLSQTLSQETGDSPTWEVLGDAYMRNGQLQEALEAYGRAEELLE
jgi:competence ComEA-like helix-hairpin-helix protein